MKYPILMFGIVLDGEITPNAILIDSASFIAGNPFQNKVDVSISAARDQGKTVLAMDNIIMDCEDMSEAMVEVSSYCLKKLAMSLLERILLLSEIEALTAQ